MIDTFCSEKDIDNKFVRAIMKQIDSDNSNTISASEFFEALIINLNLVDSPASNMIKKIKKLKYQKNLNIN